MECDFFKWSSDETSEVNMWEVLADSFLTESALDVYVSVEESTRKGQCRPQ